VDHCEAAAVSLFGIFERRSDVENPLRPLTDLTLLDALAGPKGAAGVTVTPKTSLTMSAVFRCVTLISSVSSALPLKTYKRGSRDEVTSLLLDNPHPDLTPLELWRLTYVHRCMWGNAYLQKVRDRGGRLTWLYPISPDRVKVGRVRYSAANPSGKIFRVTDDDGQEHPMTTADIFHLPGLGYDGLTGCSPIRLASQGIGLGLAAEEYGARLFGSGSLMSGILQTEQRLEQDQAEALKSRWKAKVAGLGRSHEIAVLDSGAKFQSVTMPNSDAQFLESRVFQTSEVGRFFGVPAFLLGMTEKSTSWGTGLEQQATGWVVFDLNPQWLAPTEQRITKELTGSGVYAKYSAQGLLRGDSAARAAFYRVMREVGAFSANDIRDKEDLPPVDGGNTYLQPLNMAPLGSEGTQDTGTTPPPADHQEDQS
jgi:HK97 family phage portal protein